MAIDRLQAVPSVGTRTRPPTAALSDHNHSPPGFAGGHLLDKGVVNMREVKNISRDIILLFVGAATVLLVLGGGTIFLKHVPLADRIEAKLTGNQYGKLYGWLVSGQAIRSRQSCGPTLFIGDSIVFAMATSDLSFKSENFGIPGDTSDGVLHRLPKYNLHCFKTVVLSVGVNDVILGQVAGFEERYSEILAQIPKSIKIVATAILPINERKSAGIKTDNPNGTIGRMNSVIAEACTSLPNCHFAAASLSFFDASKQLRDDLCYSDGIHLRPEGYDVWKRSFLPTIEGKDRNTKSVGDFGL